MATLQTALGASALGLFLQGCAVVTPSPLWELAKLTGGLASATLQSQPGTASHVVFHPHGAFSDLCIEYNPQTQVPDVLPALQAALQSHRIESRIYDSPIVGARCQVWLRYSAQMQWGRRWLTDDQRPYMSHAVLTLQSARGEVLSSSRYEISDMARSKWASTHDKLFATVTALISGAADGSPRASL
jgi:hypothetical protein